MFSSNGPIKNDKQSPRMTRSDKNSIIGIEEDLINSDVESFSLSPKSRSETRQARRNAESTIELSNEIISDNPLTHIFGASSSEMTRTDGRRRRGSLFEDHESEDFRSSRIFSVKAAVNRPREPDSDENETIPFIPDIDELDDTISNKGSQDVVSNFVVNKLISLQELEKDIIKHQAFSNLCGVDSFMLSSRLVSQAQVNEEDAPWTWDSLISEVASYIERQHDD